MPQIFSKGSSYKKNLNITMTKMRNNVKTNTECALYEISKMGYMKTFNTANM